MTSNTLLPAVASYLEVLNTQIIPAFKQTTSVLNAINARDGLAKLTQALVTEVVDVPLIIDDIIEYQQAHSPESRGDCDYSRLDSNMAYDVPVRIYHPKPYTDDGCLLPCLLYCHGGGSVAGSVSVYDGILRRLATHTQHIVIAPEYRLAPENPYPCAQSDVATSLLGLSALLAKQKIATNGKIVLAGDSHGGALVTNLLRDTHIQQSKVWSRISAQVLFYPNVDFTMSCPSIDRYAEGYLLSRERIAWYFNQYFQNDESRKAKSALFATQRELMNQPPALIINATFDPLYDEGVAYADKLVKAGVAVKHIEFDNVIHAYLNMENLNPEVCERTYQEIATFL